MWLVIQLRDHENKTPFHIYFQSIHKILSYCFYYFILLRSFIITPAQLKSFIKIFFRWIRSFYEGKNHSGSYEKTCNKSNTFQFVTQECQPN
jgi:hypothetical protein